MSDQDNWQASVQRHADLLRSAIASNELRLSPIAVAEALRKVQQALELVGVRERE